jgi:hypothetical protein
LYSFADMFGRAEDCSFRHQESPRSTLEILSSLTKIRIDYVLVCFIVSVTKLHASRSRQNSTTLQHEQRSTGE